MLSCTITEVHKVEPVFYDWGELKYVSSELGPSSSRRGRTRFCRPGFPSMTPMCTTR
jgi:hypothetical protein